VTTWHTLKQDRDESDDEAGFDLHVVPTADEESLHALDENCPCQPLRAPAAPWQRPEGMALSELPNVFVHKDPERGGGFNA
jgi:hypothetical protein